MHDFDLPFNYIPLHITIDLTYSHFYYLHKAGRYTICITNAWLWYSLTEDEYHTDIAMLCIGAAERRRLCNLTYLYNEARSNLKQKLLNILMLT